MRQRTRLPQRPGFTIVELMVSLALIIFIMYILAEAFAAGSAVFRRLKAIGDMNARLRTATTTMRKLLAADHFEGKKRLSDPGFWTDGPPQQGFFRLWQDSRDLEPADLPLPGPNVPIDLTHFPENFDRATNTGGEDLDGLQSYRSTRHHLHFTTRLRGNNRTEFFQATLPVTPPSPLRLPTNFTNWLPGFPRPDSRMQEASNNVYMSPWAEIALYLQPSFITRTPAPPTELVYATSPQEVTEDPNPPTGGAPLQLYTLYLRQRLLRPTQAVEQPQATGPPTFDTPIGIQIPAPIISGVQRVRNWPTQNQELSITRGGIDNSSPPPPNPFYGPDDRGTPPNRGDNAPSLYMNTPVDVTMPIRRFGWRYWDPFPVTSPVAPFPDPVPDLAGNRSPSYLPPVAFGSVNILPLPGYPVMADESPDLAGTDVLLTDVISMDVRVLLDDSAYALIATRTSPPPPGQPNTQTVQGVPYFISLHDELYPTPIYQDLVNKWNALTPAGVWGTAPRLNTIVRTKYRMDRGDLGQPPPSTTAGARSQRPARVFDTWSSRKDGNFDYSDWTTYNQAQTIPTYKRNDYSGSPIRIKAIQITLRIWDSKTKQSRQVSLIQDM